MASKFIIKRVQGKISNCPGCEELREELVFTRNATKERDEKIILELNDMIKTMSWDFAEDYCEKIHKIVKLLED